LEQFVFSEVLHYFWKKICTGGLLVVEHISGPAVSGAAAAAGENIMLN
jgi:hypothetical protein